VWTAPWVQELNKEREGEVDGNHVSGLLMRS
jgi:hypothetical protein